MFLARGLGFVVHPESLSIDHPFYGEFISQTLSIPVTRKLSIPFTAVCLIAVVIGATMLARWSRFGRNVRTIGSSEASARLMGVPIGSTKIAAYALSGLCVAAAGIIGTIYTGSGNPSTGIGLELDAIAVVVIGGTVLTGGRGSLLGTVFGLLIFGTIQSALLFDGRLSPWWSRIVVGALLLGFILLQRGLVRVAQRS